MRYTINDFEDQVNSFYQSYAPKEIVKNEKNQEEALNTNVDNAPRVVFLIDFASKEYVFVSENSSQVLGVSPAKFIEGGIATGLEMFAEHQFNVIVDFILPKLFESFNDKLLQKNVGDLRISYCTLVKCVDEYRWFLHQLSVVDVHEDGTPKKGLKTLTDIHEIKRGDHIEFFISKKDAKGIYQEIFSKTFISNDNNEVLSKREKEILQHISDGYSSKQIAETLCISENTVKNHRKNMLKKTNMSSTGELVKNALINGLIN